MNDIKYFSGQLSVTELLQNQIYSEGVYVPAITIIPFKIWIIQNHPYINYIKVYYVTTNQNLIEWNISGWHSKHDFDNQPFWNSKFITDKFFL